MPFHLSAVILRATLLGCALLALPSHALAQQPVLPPPQPTLDQVLTAVQDNFYAYLSTVPNLFADEHLVSTVNGRGVVNTDTTTDSIFRLKRATTDDHTMDLVESREIEAVNNRTARPDQALTGPSILTGIFSYAALDLSPELKRCYDYRLLPNQRLYGAAILVVDYSLKPTLPTDIKCPVTEPIMGRAFIDPISMQIVRIEQQLPKHDVYNGRRGLWSWSVDYAPENLGGKVFWLPQTISSKSSITSGQSVKWAYVATYRNYHLLTVTSTILPAGADPASPSSAK